MDTTAFERALKQHTRWTGVFFWVYRGQTLHLWSPLCSWREELTVNMHAVHNFTVVPS